MSFHGFLDIYEMRIKLLIKQDIEIIKVKDSVFIFSWLHKYDIISVI